MARSEINGKCLCGAVKVSAIMSDPILRACHCGMCRAHTSSMFMSVATEPGSVVVTGPAKSYRSSDWAERGFCADCGSTLWYCTIHDKDRNLAAGLFANAADAVLSVEYFSDQNPDGYTLAGAHKRLDSEQTIALFTSDDGAGTA